MHSIGVVYRKELTEALRDRRTLDLHHRRSALAISRDERRIRFGGRHAGRQSERRSP